jgi:hypothetical protein
MARNLTATPREEDGAAVNGPNLKREEERFDPLCGLIQREEEDAAASHRGP